MVSAGFIIGERKTRMVELESEEVESMAIRNSFTCLDGKRTCRRKARASKGRRVVGERWVFPHRSKKC